MTFITGASRVAQLSLRRFASKSLWILEVRSVKSPKKTHQKIPKKPPTEAHVCVWSPKTPPLPPITGDIWGLATGTFFEELYVYFAFLDVKGDRALLRMVLRWGLLRPRGRFEVGWMCTWKKLGGFDAIGTQNGKNNYGDWNHSWMYLVENYGVWKL